MQMQATIQMIDTHCHLDNEVYEQDLVSVITRALQAQVRQMIIPAADMRTLQRAKSLADRFKSLYFAAGAHPYDLEYFEIEKVREYALDDKCVAIGECGLDFYRLPQKQDDESAHSYEQRITAYKQKQIHAFVSQIELALELQLPLIVHIREASLEAFKILEKFSKQGLKGVLHCYNADRILLDLSENFYYGIGGVSTFKNAHQLLEVLPLIPKERLLLETDAPYLTPHPHRGTRNEPSYIPLIAEKIAETLGESIESIARLSTENAYRLFEKIAEFGKDLHAKRTKNLERIL